MSQVPDELLEQLCELIERLRAESADFEQRHEDGQLWYNRGYANGMVLALQNLCEAKLPCGQQPDDPQILQGHEVMAWGKAYRHGESMGQRETYEITGSS